MRLSLYDADLNRISIIGEHFVSCLWAEGYNTCERFSLELHDTKEHRQKVRPDFYVGRDDRNTLMVIKTVEIKNGKIVATGFQATRVLDDCSFIGTIRDGADLDTAMKNAYNSSDGVKNVSYRSTGLLATSENQVSNKSFLELSKSILQPADVGFRIVREKGELFYELYKPEENPNLILSVDYGNLNLKSIVLSSQNFKNYVIVLGEGEGATRTRVDVDLTHGEDRRDLIVDARDLQREEGETESNYLDRLKERGIGEILARQKTWECLFSPISNDFGKRFDIGDIVTVRLREHGLSFKARISRFTEKAQDNKKTTNVEVGQITITR